MSLFPSLSQTDLVRSFGQASQAAQAANQVTLEGESSTSSYI